jgi:beta-mannanase
MSRATFGAWPVVFELSISTMVPWISNAFRACSEDAASCAEDETDRAGMVANARLEALMHTSLRERPAWSKRRRAVERAGGDAYHELVSGSTSRGDPLARLR